MNYIGIDNGVTGSIALICENDYRLFIPMPVKTEQSYTKAKQNITRIVYSDLCELLAGLLSVPVSEGTSFRAFVERPMVNPSRFKATVSALRALEVTQIALEELDIAYEFIDSKQWQKAMLPSGIKGAPNLKKASVTRGVRLFPDMKVAIRNHKDADSLLIAEWARREGL